MQPLQTTLAPESSAVQEAQSEMLELHRVQLAPKASRYESIFQTSHVALTLQVVQLLMTVEHSSHFVLLFVGK